MNGAGVSVRLLGPFEVAVAGAPVAVPAGRVRTVLAALALAADHPVGTDALVRRVWGEALPAHPAASLASLVARIRRTLGEPVIDRTPAGYRLRTEPDRVDVLRFRRLVGEAAGLTDPDQVRGRLDEALRLWRGEPFTGLDRAPFSADELPRLVEEWLTATERRIGMDLAAGSAEVIAELGDLTARYPLRESLWRALITALAAAGRQADALAAYHRVRVRLRDEMGIDPSPELRDLYQELLAGQRPAGLVARPDPAPEPPRQLPADLGGFTGRAAELAELDRIFAEGRRSDGRPTVIAIDGPGGIGKTALAVHWCHRIAGDCPDGALHLDLHGYGPGDPVPPAAALDTLLRALGTPTDRIGAGAEARAAELRTRLAGRRMLLLLDNARDAETVRPLLPGSGCVVVVTSRNQLRGLAAREGARRVTLGQLDDEAATALLAEALGPDRTAAEPDAVAELVRLCARLPLALRVTAERVGRYPDVPLAELVDGLRDERSRLDGLRDDTDPAADPRAVFSWSYRALDPATARMFRLLGVHPGTDIALGPAAALAGLPAAAARRLLDRLVAGHLVQEPRPGRYEPHDLLRVYAAELAAEHETAAERDAATGRALDWYLRTVDAAFALLSPFRDPGLALDPPAVAPRRFADDMAAVAWYDVEHANLVAAVRYAFGRGDTATVTGLSRRLRDYFLLRGRWDDWEEVATMALTLARRADDRIATWAALDSLGRLRLDQRRIDDALVYYRRCLAVLGARADGREVAVTWNAMGVAHMFGGRPAEAIPWYERVLRTPWTDQLPTLANLGAAYGLLGRYEEALEVSRRAVEQNARRGHRLNEAVATVNLAEAHLNLGRYESAAEHAARALTLARQVQSTRGQAEVLVVLGRSEGALGRADAARAAFREALELLAGLGDGMSGLVREATDGLAALDA